MSDLDEYRDRFLQAMDDDFNTAGALAALFDMTRDINSQINSDDPVSRGTLAAIDRLYSELGGKVLGLIPDELGAEQATGDLIPSLMQILIDLRDSYRRNREFDKADTIRDRLALLGILLEDRQGSTTWRFGDEN